MFLKTERDEREPMYLMPNKSLWDDYNLQNVFKSTDLENKAWRTCSQQSELVLGNPPLVSPCLVAGAERCGCR